MRIHEIGEFGLIDRLAGQLGSVDKSVIVGIGDDAAVVQYAANVHVVTTTDMLVEGVHFRTDTIPDRELGWKMVAVSISDIAAMGGRPRHVLISLAIPAGHDVERLEALYAGVRDVCDAYGCHVIGGDIVKTDGPFVISVTLLGEVPGGEELRRSTARPGDLVFLTGSVGSSAAGLHYVQHGGDANLSGEQAARLLRAHQRPEPQVEAGRLLRESGACTSLNDVSDGVASESNEIAKASGVRLVLDAGKLPFDPGVLQYAKLRGADPLEWGLYGGEDYQLIGTLRAERADEVRQSFQEKGLTLFLIGRVEAGRGVILSREGEEQVLTPRGFNHFREREST